MRLGFRRLEKRIVLDAGAGDPNQNADAAVAAPEPITVDNSSAAESAENPAIAITENNANPPATEGDGNPGQATQLIFVDPSTPDAGRLLENVAAGTEVIWLSSDVDGVTQITDALTGRHDLQSIHILSHGDVGEVQLGTAMLSESSLGQYGEALTAWGQALNSNGDILFYGCDVGFGPSGQSFVDALAAATGADVAASNNDTGTAATGGDWSLETTSGSIEASLPFDPSAYQDTLNMFGWAKGATSSVSQSTQVVVDASGNTYTLGTFSGTIDFDPNAGVTNLTSLGLTDVFVSKLDASGNLAWARQIGGNNYDYGCGLAVDSTGNVYVTGYFAGTADFDPGAGAANLTSAGSYDAFVAKLDAAGNYAWAGKLGGTSADYGYDITTDSTGNVYVTGSFAGTADFDPGTAAVNLVSAGSNDAFVVKLSSTGSYAWAGKLGGTGDDQGRGIALDGSGNVLVTGMFSGTADFDPGTATANLVSAGSYDAFVGKYTSGGAYAWAGKMGGTGADYGYDIAADSAGNAYVTGIFAGTADFDPGTATVNLVSAGSNDVFVAKLTSAGAFGWADRIGSTGDDQGRGIALDSSSNVYVGGYFTGTVDFNPGTATANLVSSGIDGFACKLDASGGYLWAGKQGGSGSDYTLAVAADASGNMYTAGSYRSIADFDPGAATVNLTSSATDAYFVSKLTTAGALTWAKGALSSTVAGTAMATDSSGNVYVTGYFSGTVDFDPGAGVSSLTSVSGGNDVFILKLDASGNFLWARRIGGTSDDIARDLAVDSAGNVYTTGSFAGTVDFNPGTATNNLASAGSYDAFISKLDTNGNYVWAGKIGGTGDDQGRGIALDGSGNMYATGYFSGTADFDPGASAYNLVSAGSTDIYAVKINAAGTFGWAGKMGGTGADYGMSLALDSSANVYLTGYFAGTADFDPSATAYNLTSAGSNDVFVAKLTSTGSFGWAGMMGGTGSDVGYDIAVDSSGNVYTTGYFAGTADFNPGAAVNNLVSAGSNDIFISKLNASGAYVWAQRMGGTTDDQGRAIALDSAGNIYTTGQFQGTADFDPGTAAYNLVSVGSNSIFASKLAADGSFVWAVPLDGALSDIGAALAVDSSQNVQVAGTFQGTADFNPGPAAENLVGGLADSLFIAKLVPDTTAPTATVTATAVTTANLNATTYTFTVTYADNNQIDTAYSIGANDILVTGPNGFSQVATYVSVDSTANGTPRTATYRITTPGGTWTADDAGTYAISMQASQVRDSSGNFVPAAQIGSFTADFTVPTVASVAVPANGTYRLGQTMDFVVNFNETVNVTGTPRISITLDAGGPGYANYLSGSGTSALTFRYTVVTSNNDTNGIVVGALATNGGTIKDTGGNNATLTLANIGATTGIKVDGVLPAAPIFGNITTDSGYSATDRITTDQTLSFAGTAEANSTVAITRVGTGVVGTVTANASGAWTFNYTGTTLPVGTHNFTAVATDVAGNSGPTSATCTVVIDQTAPLVSSIVRYGSNPISTSGVFQVTFAENVTGVDTADFSLTVSGGVGGTIASVSGSGSTYLVTVNNLLAAGTVRLNLIDNDTILDYAGNKLGGTGAGNGNYLLGESYIIEKTAPTVSSIVRSGTNPASTAAVYAVTFSESVTGVDTTDFSLAATGNATGTVSSVTGSGTNYIVTISSLTGDGTLRLNLTDNDSILDLAGNQLGGAGAGNGSYLLGETYTIDATAPTVSSIVRSGANPASTSAVYAVTFSENITGVDVTDFNLAATGNATGVISSVTGSGSSYTVTVDTLAGDGTLRLNLADNDSIQDLVGNRLGGAGAGNGSYLLGETYTVDTTVPTVSSIVRSGANPNSTSAVYTVTFSESVTGVDATDFNLAATGNVTGVISSVTGSGASYTVTVGNLAGEGALRLDISDNDSILDAAGNRLGGSGAGNGSFAAGQSYAIDATAPTVASILQNTLGLVATEVDYAVTFSENVSGVDVADFALTGTGSVVGSISAITGSGSTYTVTVNTIAGDGELRLDLIDNDSITDAIGNQLGGAGAGNGNYLAGNAYNRQLPVIVQTAADNQFIPQQAQTSSSSFALRYAASSPASSVLTGSSDLNGSGDATLEILGINGHDQAISVDAAGQEVSAFLQPADGSLNRPSTSPVPDAALESAFRNHLELFNNSLPVADVANFERAVEKLDIQTEIHDLGDRYFSHDESFSSLDLAPSAAFAKAFAGNETQLKNTRGETMQSLLSSAKSQAAVWARGKG